MTARQNGDLGVRLAAAAVMVPLSLSLAWAGGPTFAGLLATGGALVTVEWTRLTSRGAGRAAAVVPAAAVVGATATVAVAGPVAGCAVLAAGGIVAAATARRFGASPAWSALGVAYAGLAVIALAVLRDGDSFGLAAILWLFALVWLADTAAFAFGRLLGGPRLAPRISPAKTWAGAIAAVAAAALVGLVTAAVLRDTSALGLAIASAGLGIAGIFGDLAESGLKRRFGAKNAGDLIPGHGGMMDRVDSLVAAAVLAAAVGLVRGGSGAPGAGVLIW